MGGVQTLSPLKVVEHPLGRVGTPPYPLWMLRIPLRGSDVRTLLARVRAVLQWPVPVRYLDPPLAQSSAHGESCTPP